MKASIGLTVSALGMACCLVVAYLLQTNFKFLNISFNQETLLGWIMAPAWFVYMLCLCTTFREPPMLELEDVLLPKSNSEKIENDLLHKGITQTFLLCAEETKQDEDDDQDCDNSEKLQRRSKNTLLPSSLRISFLTRRNHSVLGNSF